MTRKPPRLKGRRYLTKVGVIMLVLYAVWCALVVAQTPNQIYLGVDTPFEDARFADHAFTADDGASIPVAVRVTQSAPVVLYFMGNAASRQLFVTDFDALLDLPVTLVVMSYRGGEGSDLDPSEARLKADADQMLDRLPTLIGYDPAEVHVMGYSLGSGIALSLAADHDLSSVVLKGAMPRLCAMIGRVTLTPLCWLPGVDRWDNFTLARRVAEPVLMIYGLEDDLFPPSDQQRLAAQFGMPPQMVAVPNAGHNDLAGAAMGQLRGWLDMYP